MNMKTNLILINLKNLEQQDRISNIINEEEQFIDIISIKTFQIP